LQTARLIQDHSLVVAVHVDEDGEAAVDVWNEVRFEDGWIRGLIERSQSEAGDESSVFLDELGRPVEAAWRGFDGAWVHAAVTYDHGARRDF
jgi:hypothetical protein